MTLANKLTCLRIVMVPIVWFMAMAEGAWLSFAAAVVFLLAAATDAVDGHLARKTHTVTSLGKILDPVADKLIFFAAVIPLMVKGEVPAWMVMVFLSREIAISALRQVVIAQGGEVIAAALWGKLKTVLQDIAVVALLVAPVLTFVDTLYLGDIAMWAAVILAIISAVDYFAAARSHITWGAEHE